jgi:uncharacterized OB-fold protein
MPNPPITPESAPFFAAAKEGRFLIRRCGACGKAHWYPRALCPFCFGETTWEEASGKGRIYSYSVMRRASPPYAIAYVTLAEGPTMMTNLVDCDFDALGIGQDVSLVFKPSENGTPVPCFRPLSEGDAHVTK